MIRFLKRPAARVDLTKARPCDRFKFAGRLYKIPVNWRPTATAVSLITYCEICGAAFLFTALRRPARLRKWCSPCARGPARPSPLPAFILNSPPRTTEKERSPK